MHRTIDSLIANQEVYSVGPGTSVVDAAKYMSERNIGAVSVIDGKSLIGIISERDLMRRVVAEGRDPTSTRVDDVMSRRLVHGVPGDSYTDCIEKMLANRCRHLPILNGDLVVGMVSIRDLYRVEASEKAEELEYMNAYVNSAPSLGS